jgi:hypothetical protein
MMLASAAPRHKNRGRPLDKIAHAFRKWALGRGCLLKRHRAGGCGPMPGRKPVEFAHVDCAGKGTSAAKGIGTKVADKFGLPLCPKHHDEQHGKIGPFRQRGGWPTFQLKYGFDAEKEAVRLWNLWDGRVTWEKKCG